MINFFYRHAWTGPRKFLTTFVLLVVVGGLGLAAAAWFSTPNGHGNAYGKGRNTTGLALTSVDLTNDAGLTAIGPSESGSVKVVLHNPNANFDAVATSISPAGPIFSVDDPLGCTASPPVATVTPFSGSLAVPRGGDSAMASLALVTNDALPVCMSGHVLAIDVTIVSAPAP